MQKNRKKFKKIIKCDILIIFNKRKLKTENKKKSKDF